MTEIVPEERALNRYREVVASAGAQENRVLDKSVLYQRLLAGLQPLILPPPLNHSYPWYRVVESDSPISIPFGPEEWTPDWDSRHGVLICQSVWTRLEGDVASDLTVTCPGWDAMGFVWRIWQADEPASAATATLCCWHRDDVSRLTTPELVEAECRWRIEREAAWVSAAGKMDDEALREAIISSGQAGKPGDRLVGFIASQCVMHIRALKEQRIADGLPLDLTPAEIEAKIEADMSKLLGDSWVVRDGELYHRAWLIQRISPVALGTEHYLEPA
ncbi:hypothetical protein [Pseudomonas mosselii]|uniref:hypothetical protein n=1 Tax=Pseudomonas mosselii TaxID=78327 RepID=UPI0021DA4256|nr:hypothetical protein [Pseudomonas mosselii]MCU9528473.1 hypothetical protein [Pseudomonas mosselii]MCU9535807.1 hypothetical protein [Pseudomonas mosselii]MCU9543880.1 hypothetical protein [Pseudomonas mosselii]MCU9550465.1 hypothetical protein [Pseudomonas mosselii]